MKLKDLNKLNILKQTTLKNGKNISIIKPGPEMASEIVTYVNQVGGESDNLTFGANGFNTSINEEAEFLKKTLDDGFNLMVAGLIEGKVVSVGSLNRNSRDRMKHLGVLGISVLKEFWGQGIARVMMETIIEWSRQNDVMKIQLKVKTDNFNAIKLYENLGFLKEGFHPQEIRIDGIYFDYISMGLNLDRNYKYSTNTHLKTLSSTFSNNSLEKFNNFEIVPAITSDKEGCYPLNEQLGYHSDLNSFNHRFESLLSLDSHKIIVAKKENKIVAWMHLEIVYVLEEQNYVRISAIVVHKDFRSSGLGAQLLKTAESWTKSKGLNLIKLHSSITRKEAHEFYIKNGFSNLKTSKLFLKELI